MAHPSDGALRYDRLHQGEELSYVQKVMESLSDGVGALLLAIIPLQDSNAPLPPDLPASTDTVSKLCKDVVEVATELGEEEYGEYPKIQKEIFDACDELSVATGGLLASVTELGRCAGSERANKWNGLGESVKVIVAKTIQLLEIVYNCEIMRLWEATKRLADLAKGLDPSQTPTNAVGVRDGASELASKAKEVSQYMHEVAGQQPSELIRNELNETGDKLDDLADRILAATNELLRDRANPEKQKKVRDLTAELEDALARAQAALDALNLMGQKAEPGMDTESLTPLGSEKERKRDKDGLDSKSSWDPEDELAFAAKKAKDEAQKLQKKSKDGDQKGTDDAARTFQREANNAADAARELAEDLRNKHKDHHPSSPSSSSSSSSSGPSSSSSSSDPRAAADLQRAQQLDEASDKLRSLIQPANKAARDTAADPQNQAKVAAVDQAVGEVVKLLDDVLGDVGRKHPEALIESSVRKIHGDVDDLTHGPRDPKHIEEAARDIEKELDSLKSFPDAKKSDRQFREVSERLLPLLIEEQLTSIRDPGHKHNPQVHDALLETVDAIGEKTKPNHAANLIEAVRDSERELAKIKADAHNKDAPGVKDSADKVVALKEKIKDAAAAISDQLPHNEKGREAATRVAGTLADYDGSLPAVLRDSVAVIREPAGSSNYAGLRDDLDRDLARALADLNRLVDLANAQVLGAIKEQKEDLADLSAAVLTGDTTTAVQKATKAAERQPNDIRRPAEILAERVKDSDPEQHRAIHDRLDEIDRLLPEQIQAAKEVLADPHNEKAKQKLHHAKKATEEALDDLAGTIQGDRSKYGKAQPHNAHHQALEALVPIILHSAENNDWPALLDALEKASTQLHALPLDEKDDIKALVEKEKKGVDQIQDSVAARDPQEVVSAAQTLMETNNKLAEAAKQAANKLPIADPRRKPLQEAATALQQVFPLVVQSAKESLKDPSNPIAERAMRDHGQQLKEIADSIARNIGPATHENLSDLADEIKATAHNIDSTAKNGQVPQTSRLQDKLKELEGKFEDALRDAARYAPSDAERTGLLREVPVVNKAIEAVRDTAGQVSHQPSNKRLLFALDDEIAALVRLLDDIVARTKADALAAIEKEERALQNVLANPNNPELRELLNDAQRELKEALAPHARNPEVAALVQHLDQETVPRVVHSSDSNKLPTAVANAEKDLKKLRAVLEPSLENAIAATCKEEEAAALAFRDAVREGDRGTATAALVDLKGAQAKLEPLVAEKIHKSTPKAGEDLSELIEDLKQKIASELAPSAAGALGNPSDKAAQDKLHNTVEKMRDVLDAIATGAEPKTRSDEIRAAQSDLDDLVATARDPRKRGDRKRLLEIAKALADKLRNMIENAKKEALAKGLDSGELDEILRALAATEAGILGGTHTLGDLDALLKRFGQLTASSSSGASSSSAPLPPLPSGPKPEPVTLDEKLDRVADEVHEAVAQTSTSTQDYLPTGLLAEEFRKLAQAAKEGNRSGMILIGRNIHSLIAALVAKIIALANTCKDKYLKDRLLRLVDPLRNYSTQLKILCSVKAATNKPDADADEQLASVTRSLGNLVADSVRTVDTGIKTKRLVVS